MEVETSRRFSEGEEVRVMGVLGCPWRSGYISTTTKVEMMEGVGYPIV